MNWELMMNAVTVLEIIGVEFTSVWLLSKRKHSFWTSFGTYLLLTILVFLFMLLVATRLPGYGNGSGRFMVLGIVYFIPTLVNYGGDWKSRLIIAFYSFSYGLAGFALAVRIGYLFPARWLSLSVLIAQTVLYAVSLPLYLKFSRRRFIPYLNKTDSAHKNLLIRYTIASFLLIIAYNSTMVADYGFWQKLLVYLLLLYFILLTYKLTVSYLKTDDDNRELNELALTDRLTKLGNRLAFRNRAEQLLREKQPFVLFFLDLDRFKSINDRFGHLEGDAYLRRFADALNGLADETCQFFRLSGDEFVGLALDENKAHELGALRVESCRNVVFLGFSLGSARFPEDGKTLAELFERADQGMYRQKRAKF